MMNQLLFFSVAMASGLSLTWIVRFCALKKGIVNKPNPIIPQHVKPIAYLGGVGILSGVLFALISSYNFQTDMFHGVVSSSSSVEAIVFGSVTYLIWGVYDDLKQLKALPKFLGQLGLAFICVGMGIRTSFFPSVVLDFSFSVFWIVAVINAVNFTDVCDGLVGGISAVTFFIIGILVPQFMVFCFLISGATVGFLFFNLHKASIFLGDAGSHLLGFLIATLGILGGNKLHLIDAAVWMSFIAAVPIFELLFLTVVRYQKGMNVTHGSPDHFSLRLQKAGFTRLQIVGMACLVTAASVTIGCLFRSMELWQKISSVVFILVLFIFVWRYLLRWDLSKK
ncbi:MAG TPA: MraY family glycosyltransferase [Panacibacter sp.]|nr:MraY family glycosyltransferase [Panacibacter sp.]